MVYGLNRMRTAKYAIVAQPEQIEIRALGDDALLATLCPWGPTLADAQSAALEILENGPYFTWLRWNQSARELDRQIDLQVDALGRMKCIQRIQSHLGKDAWCPDFGFEFRASRAKCPALSRQHFLALDSRGSFAARPERTLGCTLADGASVAVANPLALRQHRGTLESRKDREDVVIRLARLEPIRQEYLDQAQRLWREFHSKQAPDLLFTQSGKPATGNDLYIRDDDHGYKFPFYKSYIVQYATNSLPLLLECCPTDRHLRATILACNDWMARVQTEAGGWSYPGPTTAGFGLSLEYVHGMGLALGLEAKPEYLDAIRRTLRTIVVLTGRHGTIPGRIASWESQQGVTITPETTGAASIATAAGITARAAWSSTSLRTRRSTFRSCCATT